MTSTTETYRERLKALANKTGSSSKAQAVAATRVILREMRGEIEALIERGEKATAIAKALAPRGERPSWETVRRAIAQEFDIAPQTRKARGKGKGKGKNGSHVTSNASSKAPARTIIGGSKAEVTPPVTQAPQHQATGRNARF